MATKKSAKITGMDKVSLTLRLDAVLHQHLTQQALDDRRSLNQHLILLLINGSGFKQLKKKRGVAQR